MDKDEILEKAKKENKKKEPFEQEIYKTGLTVGIWFGLTLCTIFTTLEIKSHSNRFLGYYVIMFAICCGTCITRAIKFKRKKDIIFSVLSAVITLALSAVHIYLVVTSYLTEN